MNESHDAFAGGGVMSALMRAFDWTMTPLGLPDDWPPAWRVALQVALGCRFPVMLAIGPELTLLYNDAYTEVLANRHPSALGRPLRAVWPEVWETSLAPATEQVMVSGASFFDQDTPTVVERLGYAEEAYFTYSMVPLREGDGPASGVMLLVMETTQRILEDRRRRCENEIVERTSRTESTREASLATINALASCAGDFPLGRIYVVVEDRLHARLVASTDGAHAEDPESETVPVGSRPSRDPWGVARAYSSRQPVLVSVAEGDRPFPVLATPLFDANGAEITAVFVLGLNPRRPLDEMLEVARTSAARVQQALALVRSREFARERTDSLATLDRAKTIFFSDLSHEFRTPLTLLLGPIEDVLTRGTLAPRERTQIETAARASRRLLRLVNALLDFSRIEAGRADPSFEPVELASFTSDLAAMFRSAFERAGLALIVDCPPLDQQAYVDRAMWEKIVLNLLSNALKFTFAGHVQLRQVVTGGDVVLTVQDTGCGISPEHLPYIFERFYRAHISAMRTAEGSGIGLSLVDELVRLHGGSISASSEPFSGTTMTVRIPLGYQHLPRARVVHTARPAAPGPGGMSFVEEALSWMTEEQTAPAQQQAGAGGQQRDSQSQVSNEHDRARLLVVDDNGDMREYLRRILSERWTVEIAGDGLTALTSIRQRAPNLVIADVMMPGLDGFELLRVLREADATAEVPVMLVSARAGEEAASEGLRAGADDYLTKPFSARELVARVEARLADARRRAAERRAREAAEEASRVKNDVLTMLSHELRTPLTPIIASAQALQRDPSLSHEQRESAKLILNAAQLEARFIDDLLDLTRGAHGMLTLSSRLVDVHEIVRRVAALMEQELRDRGLTLTMELNAEAAQMVGDPGRLQQVIWNLLQNAMQYTVGGLIRLRTSSMLVADAPEGAHRLRVEMQDSGIGLEREMLEKIFEPFERGSQAVHRRSGGLGLGLAISRRLVELHGGTLTATSEGPGRGSTFVLEVPSTIADAVKAPASTFSVAHPGRVTRRVLLVEDDVRSALALHRLLKSYDYDVEIASTRAEALAAAQRAPFDIVVSDLQLPDGSGLDIVKQIRRLTPVAGVALSGMGTDEDVRRSIAAGYAEHLVKPPEGEHLVAAIERAIQSSSGEATV